MLVVFAVLSFTILLLSFILLRRSQKGTLLTIDNVVVLCFAIIWGILFPVTYFYSLKNQSNEYLAIISDYSYLEVILYYACVILFLCFFILVFRGTVKKSNYIPHARIENYVDKSKYFFTTAVIVFLIGVVSDYLYCRAYGGYLGYLQYSAYIRSGLTSVVPNSWSFLIVFRDCIIISSYLFFAQIKENGKVRIDRLILFIISFILSLLVLYANKGRLSFVIYLVVFLLVHLLNMNKIKHLKMKHTVVLVILGCVAVFGFVQISQILDRSSTSNAWDLFVSETAFVFANFKVLINEMELGDCRLFIDIIAYPLFLLPSSLWRKVLPDTASDIMTIFIFDAKKGDNNVYGEAPIDAISIGYLQCGIIGVCVFAIFFGIITAKLYNLINNISNEKIKKILIVYTIIDIVLRSLFYADSYNIVQRCFSLVVFGLVYFGVGLLYEKNKCT